jgi:hypothetical protein
MPVDALIRAVVNDVMRFNVYGLFLLEDESYLFLSIFFP